MAPVFRRGSALVLPAVLLASAVPVLYSPCSDAAAAPTAGPVEQLTHTNLVGTDAFAEVPARFDPVHATDAVLAQYGFPPRPNSMRAPDGYAAWQRGVTGMQRVTPNLKPGKFVSAPIMNFTAGLDGAAGTSSNWSGYVSAGPALAYGAQSLVNIYGDWMVTVAQPAFNGCLRGTDGTPVNSATFVGLDGNGSGDVLQAGTEADATCNNGFVGSFYSAWYEWYPFSEVRVTNLPIGPGAAMYVYVWATSDRAGHAYISNETTNSSVSLQFSPPAGFSLIGNSAEWIIERPAVNGVLSDLTNYVQEFMTSASASDAQGNEYYPGAGQPAGQPQAEAIDMLDNNNLANSIPVLTGNNGVWFNAVGSAQHIPHS